MSWRNALTDPPPCDEPVLAWTREYINTPHNDSGGYLIACYGRRGDDDLFDVPRWWDYHGSLIGDTVDFWMPLPPMP
jgi:hypothetical protein